MVKQTKLKQFKDIYSLNRDIQEIAIRNEMIVNNLKHATLTAKRPTVINGRALVNMANLLLVMWTNIGTCKFFSWFK